MRVRPVRGVVWGLIFTAALVAIAVLIWWQR